MNKHIKFIISVPCILIAGEDEQSLLIKKGNRELFLQFDDPKDRNTVIQILDKTRIPISLKELISTFPVKNHHIVEKIVSQFIQMNILVENGDFDISGVVLDRYFEDTLNNYFWEKDINWTEFLLRQDSLSFRIVGVNQLGMLIVDLLKKVGISNIKLVDYPFLRNIKFKENETEISNCISFDCLLKEENKEKTLIILADEFGNIPSLLHLNHIFFNEKRNFFPIFVLSQIGHIGPLVVPGKTSCFQCFISRLEQGQGELNYLDASEADYFEWQKFSSIHPSVLVTLAHFFTFQLTLSMGPTDSMANLSQSQKMNPFLNYCNTVTEMDLLTPKIVTRRFLRKPNCSCCQQLMFRQKVVFDLAKDYV